MTRISKYQIKIIEENRILSVGFKDGQEEGEKIYKIGLFEYG